MEQQARQERTRIDDLRSDEQIDWSEEELARAPVATVARARGILNDLERRIAQASRRAADGVAGELMREAATLLETASFMYDSTAQSALSLAARLRENAAAPASQAVPSELAKLQQWHLDQLRDLLCVVPNGPFYDAADVQALFASQSKGEPAAGQAGLAKSVRAAVEKMMPLLNDVTISAGKSGSLTPLLKVMDEVNATLAAPVAADTEQARDAARYRWLRNQQSWGTVVYEAIGYGGGEGFDKAIDAAMGFTPEEISPALHSDEALRKTEGYRLGYMEGMSEGARLATEEAGEQASEPPHDLTIGEAFKSVGGWMNGGETGYPSFGSMNALYAYTVKMIRSYVENKAYRAPLATPADAGAGEGLTNAEIDSITRHYTQEQHYDSIRACVAFATARLEQRLAHVMRDLNGPTHFGEPVLARLSTPGAPVTAPNIDKPEFRDMLFRFAREAMPTEEIIAHVQKRFDAYAKGVVAATDYLHAELEKARAPVGQSPAPVTDEPVAYMHSVDLDKPLFSAYSPKEFHSWPLGKKADITPYIPLFTTPQTVSTELQKGIDSIADELEQEAMNYEGDFADTVKGCVEALRDIATHSAPARQALSLQTRDAIRDQALEEAAKWLDWYDGSGMRRAEAIRGLKSMERAADAAETRDAKGGE